MATVFSNTARRLWRTESSRDVLALLLLLVLPVACFPELFFTPSTLYRADLTWFHYPLRVLAAEQWKAGQVPLWNPYVQAGFPLLAEGQAGVLYPLNALFLLPLPPYRALTLFVALHLTLAASSTYLLARWLGLQRPAALLGALSFGFGGFMMAQVTHLNIMTGAAWLPLVFGLYDRALATRRLHWAAWGGLALALQCLTAQPQVVFYTLVVLGGYAVYWTGRRVLAEAAGSAVGAIRLPCRVGQGELHLRRWIRPWLALGLLLVSGLLLAAPQVLPTWELTGESVRSAGVDFRQMTELSLPPVQWIALALPGVFGNNVAASFQGPVGNFEEMHVYIGMLPLVMVPFSWRSRHRGQVLFLWLTAFFGAWLAMGSGTFLYGVLQVVPGFNYFRVPARWLLVVHFALALLAGFGFDSLLRQPAGRRARIALLAGWGMAVAMLGGLWVCRLPIYDWATAFAERNDLVYTLRMLTGRGLFQVGDGYAGRLILGPLAWWATPAVALATRLGAAVLLVVGYSAARLTRRSSVACGLALLAVDVVLSGGSAVNRLTGADLWQQVSDATRYVVTAQLEHPGRLLSLAGGNEKDIVAGLGQDTPGMHHVLAASGHASPLRLARYDVLVQQAHPLTMLALTGTRFVLNKGRLTEDAESVLSLVYQDRDWYVYQNPAALPRALVVHQASHVTGEEPALARLRDPAFDPRQQVLLEIEPPLLPATSAPAAAERVAITTDEPWRVEIQTDLTAPGYLVLLDNFYPGWEADADGAPTPILRADYFARAVSLAAGRHLVRFVYRPLSFRLGLGLCAAGMLLVLCMWVSPSVRSQLRG